MCETLTRRSLAATAVALLAVYAESGAQAQAPAEPQLYGFAVGSLLTDDNEKLKNMKGSAGFAQDTNGVYLHAALADSPTTIDWHLDNDKKVWMIRWEFFAKSDQTTVTRFVGRHALDAYIERRNQISEWFRVKAAVMPHARPPFDCPSGSSVATRLVDRFNANNSWASVDDNELSPDLLAMHCGVIQIWKTWFETGRDDRILVIEVNGGQGGGVSASVVVTLVDPSGANRVLRNQRSQ